MAESAKVKHDLSQTLNGAAKEKEGTSGLDELELPLDMDMGLSDVVIELPAQGVVAEALDVEQAAEDSSPKVDSMPIDFACVVPIQSTQGEADGPSPVEEGPSDDELMALLMALKEQAFHKSALATGNLNAVQTRTFPTPPVQGAASAG